MKKSDVQPNTIYRVRATRHGTTPIGFDKFVLTGDEIIGVTSDHYNRDKTTTRYVEVYPIEWDSSRWDHTGRYVAATDTKQIAFKDIDGDWRWSWCDTEWTSKLPNWDEDVPVHRIEAKAGDCILFSEKLKHGTIPWSGSDERRTLFYKYVPFGLHHPDAGYATNWRTF